MDWMKIGSALFIGAMLVYLLPRAKQMIKQSPKASGEDWRDQSDFGGHEVSGVRRDV